MEQKKTVYNEISEIKQALVRIETLLVGEEGSGVMHRIKRLEEAPDRNLTRYGTISSIAGSITAIFIAIFKK